jgi:invasion protein IalB
MAHRLRGHVLRAFALGFAAIVLVLDVQAAAAQGKPKPPTPDHKPAPAPAPPAPQPPANAQEPPKPQPGWISRCMSENRATAVDCTVEQTAVVTNTGQLVASVVVRVPHDTRQPVMLIQVPVGLFLPAGVNVQVDETKPLAFAFQTCDLKGCYAGAPLPAETLAAMKTGKKLAVIFQNLQKETISIPLPLDNFAEAFARIQ